SSGPRTTQRKNVPTNIVTITDSATGAEAKILVSLGFNCFSWRCPTGDGLREMLWAHPKFADGGERPSGSGIPLLFPFPGRIGGTRLEFGGRAYELEPGDAHGNAIHGFVYNRPWRVIEQQKHRAVGEFQASVDDPGILQRWPSDFRIRVTYEVRGSRLLSEVSYRNTGDGPLPCGFGTHAYFRLPLVEGSDAADTIVTAPVREYWELATAIPTGKRIAVEAQRNLAAGLRLADHQFDTVFTGIEPDADGKVRTTLRDPRSGQVLTQTFDRRFTQCVVYTPPHREAICLEPYTCVPDALRLAAKGHVTGLAILKPGESVTMELKLEMAKP
ncbi:MAG: aldose 1-epimerase, partial [Pirellulaceae bacterium]